MDEAGSFHLKNLGKCSILVNNKEVPSGQTLSLSSSCLIEVCSSSSFSITIIIALANYVDLFSVTLSSGVSF